MSRRRRGSGIAEFFDGFNQGYTTVGRVLQDRELRRIATEAPIESQGYTEDQGNQLRAAADRGDKIDIRYKDDGQGNQVFDRYVVMPGGAEGQAGTSGPLEVAMQKVTDFMGERRAGRMTEAQLDRARTMAQAGVLSRFGNPLEAQRLRQQVGQSEQLERQGVLTDLQIGRAQREEETQAKLGEVNDAVAAYMRNRIRLGEDGQPMPLTDDDFVMAGKQRVFELANRGLFDQALAAARESMEHATRKIQAETAERQVAVRDAVARIAQGDFAAAMAAFNRFVPDGNIIQNVTQNRDGSFTLERISGVDGAKLPPGKVESLDRLVAAVQSIADPNALVQQVERTFRNDVETRRLRLSENADRRADAQFAQGQADRKQAQADASARSEAAVAYAEERARAQGRTLSDAERNAIRTGVIDAVPRADGNAPAQVQLARAMVESGLAPDMKTALDRAMSTRSKSARDTFIDLMKPDSVTRRPPSEAQIAPVMEAAFGADWRDQVRGQPAGQSRAASPAPAPIARRGQVVDGYEFRGGDPNDQRNWRQVNQP